jgi:hypothetical protein
MNKMAQRAEYWMGKEKDKAPQIEPEEQKDAPLEEDGEQSQIDEAKSSERIFIIDPVKKKDVAVWDMYNMKKAQAYIKKNPSYIMVITDPTKINDVIAQMSENANENGDQLDEAVDINNIIKQEINTYTVADDPYDVAMEIGKKYNWSQKQIEKAEKIIRRKYIK